MQVINPFEEIIERLSRIENRILNDINDREQLNIKANSRKQFFSPKEFAHITGMKYSTIIYRCKIGKLKARQDDPNCSWQIFATEIDRFKTEANENTI